MDPKPEIKHGPKTRNQMWTKNQKSNMVKTTNQTWTKNQKSNTNQKPQIKHGPKTSNQTNRPQTRRLTWTTSLLSIMTNNQKSEPQSFTATNAYFLVKIGFDAAAKYFSKRFFVTLYETFSDVFRSRGGGVRCEPSEICPLFL